MQNVAAYLRPGAGIHTVGVVGEIFNRPPFTFAYCADTTGPLTTDVGLTVHIEHGLDRLKKADLILLLPGEGHDDPPSQDLTAILRKTKAIVAAPCVGAFMLAATGLLDGRHATTHWAFTDRLAQTHPNITVTPDALYVDEGRLLTGAGVAAAADLCLHVIRRELGARKAGEIARAMVIPPHREGGQRQYATTPVAEVTDDRLAHITDWAQENLAKNITVADLARRALVSERGFARRFKDATGQSPHAWLTERRLRRAEELLEGGDLSVEEIAHHVGYGSAAALRRQFARRRGVAPRDYRRTFRG
ncbi:AraC family transcriptional regulator [Actinorhabdospora filicis]|uniref:AraC family transcriptional regulator n=1 Tax=Actinorhabdospora filicis TaxID=1785913 RepID=A0A9W6SHR5_9ACTN|nr:helix-turn-helix domain-containing protein [Actinorhabdospora filicis]GLZ77350.1 AraC family transcriptional regulator [Actinorhabdospora filicis]